MAATRRRPEVTGPNPIPNRNRNRNRDRDRNPNPNPNPNPIPTPNEVLEGNAQAARQQIGYGVDVDTVDDEGSPLVVLVRMDIEP